MGLEGSYQRGYGDEAIPNKHDQGCNQFTQHRRRYDVTIAHSANGDGGPPVGRLTIRFPRGCEDYLRLNADSMGNVQGSGIAVITENGTAKKMEIEMSTGNMTIN